MNYSLKRTYLNIWKSNTERKGIKSEFSSEHIKFIGVENPAEYNDILKTYLDKFTENNSCVIFDGQIPFAAEFDLINYVNTELLSMNINDISHQDINLFDNNIINQSFLNGLQYIVQLAIKQEHFMNDNVRNNFICKQIVWAYLYIRNLEYKNNFTPKCLYYGDISKHEIYFLMLLVKMNFDVIFINPAREENWNIDVDNLFITMKFKQVASIESLKIKSNNGHTINFEESLTLQFSHDIEQQLFTDSGVFKPWQFKNYTPINVYIQSTIIDLENNWEELARLRQGFKIKDNNIYIPTYFQQIEGVNENKDDYYKLLQKCINSKNTLVIKDNGQSLLNTYDPSLKYQLVFNQLNDKSYDINGLKQLPFYPLKNYKIEIQDLILKKINECILDPSLFTNPLNEESILDFVMTIMNISSDIIKLIDGFDYAQFVPKITILLENGELTKEMIYILGFLHKCSFDIVIFNPSGLFDIRNFINPNQIDDIRLEEIDYDFKFLPIKTKSKFTDKIKKLFT